MTGNTPTAEILAGPQRRRRWSAAEKVAMVAEIQEQGVTAAFGALGLAARRRFDL